jgi:hypothetical protein
MRFSSLTRFLGSYSVVAPLSERRTLKGGIWTHPVVADGRLHLPQQELTKTMTGAGV